MEPGMDVLCPELADTLGIYSNSALLKEETDEDTDVYAKTVCNQVTYVT